MALVILCAVAAIIIAAICLAAHKAFHASAPAEAPDFTEISFDPTRYRAMQRILSPDDWTFVASTVRSAEALRKARSERKQLFSRYLKNLEADFGRLHASARALLVDAPEDRPELTQALISQQFAFQRAMFATRVRLYAPVLGDAAAEVGRLVDLAEGMMATGRLAIASESAAA